MLSKFKWAMRSVDPDNVIGVFLVLWGAGMGFAISDTYMDNRRIRKLAIEALERELDK